MDFPMVPLVAGQCRLFKNYLDELLEVDEVQDDGYGGNSMCNWSARVRVRRTDVLHCQPKAAADPADLRHQLLQALFNSAKMLILPAHEVNDLRGGQLHEDHADCAGHGFISTVRNQIYGLIWSFCAGLQDIEQAAVDAHQVVPSVGFQRLIQTHPMGGEVDKRRKERKEQLAGRNLHRVDRAVQSLELQP